MQKLIVVIGPTASKKTTLAHQIALAINGEIINGDVFQMYKELQAGVNKPSAIQQQEVNYHLINNLSIFDKYSIYNYQKDFVEAYQKITKKNKPIILCGGSHLYIDAIVRGYDLSDQNIQMFYDKLSGWSSEQLMNYIKVYDPDSASKVINNRHRMQRVVAFLQANDNLPKNVLERQRNKQMYQTLIIMTNKSRKELYDVINKRFDTFLTKNSWIQEVQELIDKYGLDVGETQAFRAIGYPEIFYHLTTNEPLNIEKIKSKTRHLAKHQLTWCNNKFLDKIMFDYEHDDFARLIEKIKSFLYD